MATQAFEKTPNETKRLGYDFTSELLTSETITEAKTSISVTNLLTDADATSSILVAGSTELSDSTIVRGRFAGGSDGDKYKVTVRSGATNFANSYEEEFNLIITNTPEKFLLLSNRDEIKRHLGIATTDTSDDQRLDDCLLAASKYIRSRTRRDFDFRTYTEIVYPVWGDRTQVRVSHYPLVQVDEMVLKDYDSTDQTSITDTSTYYWSYNEWGFIWFQDGNYFNLFPNLNTITYRAGYPLVPADLREACKLLVVGTYRTIGREGLNSERIGDYFYKVKDLSDLPPNMKAEIPDMKIEGVIKRYTKPDNFWTEM